MTSRDTWPKKFLLLWERPVFACLLSLLVYCVLTSYRTSIFHMSSTRYFNFLADAFLHGQLSLRTIPPSVHDLIVYHDRLYPYWPPMPAILVLPLAAVFGPDFSDVFVTLVLGAANVGLIALLLRLACAHRVVRLSRLRRAILVVFFAFGTVHTIMPTMGTAWYLGQLTAFFFTILTFLPSIAMKGWKAFFLTGVALACACLTRNNVFLVGIWPAYRLIHEHLRVGPARLARCIAIGALPMFGALAIYCAYNYARFGGPFDVGLEYHRMAPIFREDFDRYGLLNIAYVPKNFYYQMIYYPFPFRAMSYMGGSLFLMSPIFFGMFAGIVKGRPRISALFMLATVVLTYLPIVTLMGTGYVQWGPRYTLDLTVPLLLLTAMGISRWSTRVLGLLTILSVLHYVGGYLLVPLPR